MTDGIAFDRKMDSKPGTLTQIESTFEFNRIICLRIRCGLITSEELNMRRVGEGITKAEAAVRTRHHQYGDLR
jgi:hypothetical protein